MPKKRWAFHFAWLTLCAVAAAFSAPPRAAAGTDMPFLVDSWDNEKGLPDREVISVIQTRDGYLGSARSTGWCASTETSLPFSTNRTHRV